MQQQQRQRIDQGTDQRINNEEKSKPDVAQLQAQYERILAEIREYPFPIPACDAQYNYLVEQRGKLRQQIQRAKAAAEAQA